MSPISFNPTICIIVYFFMYFWKISYDYIFKKSAKYFIQIYYYLTFIFSNIKAKIMLLCGFMFVKFIAVLDNKNVYLQIHQE